MVKIINGFQNNIYQYQIIAQVVMIKKNYKICLHLVTWCRE